jgi:hypothetical protein
MTSARNNFPIQQRPNILGKEGTTVMTSAKNNFPPEHRPNRMVI